MRGLITTLAAAAVLLVAPAAAHASVYPQSIVFGQTTANTTDWVTVSNDSADPWYMDYSYFYDGTAFSIPVDDCSGTILPAYGSCSIEIQFDAGDTNIGDYTYYDTLAVEHYDEDTYTWDWDYVWPVTGTKGFGDQPSVSPTSVDFGSHTDAAVQTITVTNAENQPIDVSKGAVNGGAPFSISADACGLTVASGDSCSIDVRFDPTAAGPGSYHDSMSLSWTDSNGTTPQRIDLAARVPSPPPPPSNLELSPSVLHFGQVSGPSTATITVTQMTANATAHIDGVTAGTAASAFSITADDCSDRTLAYGEQCSFDVRFAPSRSGSDQGTVTVISANSAGTVYTATVDGTYVGAAPAPYVSRGGLSHRSFYPLRHDGYRDSVLYRFRSGIEHRSAAVHGGPIVTVTVRSLRSLRVVMSWTFQQRGAAVRAHAIRWNGRGSSGRLVRPGLYGLRAQVQLADGSGRAINRMRTVRVRRGR